MLQVLDKYTDKKQEIFIVKMDIHTYEEFKAKNPSIRELAEEARNSKKVFHTHEELMADLMS